MTEDSINKCVAVGALLERFVRDISTFITAKVIGEPSLIRGSGRALRIDVDAIESNVGLLDECLGETVNSELANDSEKLFTAIMLNRMDIIEPTLNEMTSIIEGQFYNAPPKEQTPEELLEELRKRMEEEK